ncbi:cysteine proteinase inhibitor 1-like [Cucurbita moschata]|uniref:Cysteine proteinase inhibitor 1-like n=1 Tax=Cucurbita moschata TaxID=3662 RepID=A0A6J1F6X0_CUCMO|nr:cysteine proteinase inhibitor 1-like [Cucurbita moschata]
MSSVAAASQNDGLIAKRENMICGGWSHIKDINDPKVQERGRFAVMEHNNQSGEHLIFSHVDDGWTQVVSGINYRLVIRATKEGDNGIYFYEAIVWDVPWEQSWTLISFKPLLKHK